MRDTNKKEEYFKELHATDKEEYDTILNELKEFKASGEGGEEDGFHLELYTILQNLISEEYALGFEMVHLKERSEYMIKHLVGSFIDTEDYSDGGDLGYSSILEVVSFGVLLNLHEELEKLANCLNKVNYSDYMVSFLLRGCGIHQKEQLLFSKDKGFQFLKKITESPKNEAESLTKEYLNNFFYSKANLGSNYNSHKRKDDTYLGYNSWKIGAIVKVMGLNDNDFKDSPYYPYEMVHWQDEVGA